MVLTREEWADVADLLDQCIAAAEVDETYTKKVIDKSSVMIAAIRNEAVDRSRTRKVDIAGRSITK